MKLGGYCPGCGGGEGNQSCAIARCSLGHGRPAYCGQCGEYPCRRYAGFDEYDSFITHQHRERDMERLRQIGPEAFHRELSEREGILHFLLENYNDGRKKTLFCLAASLLELPELKAAVWRLQRETDDPAMPLKEKAACAARLLRGVAAERGVTMKLRRKRA